MGRTNSGTVRKRYPGKYEARYTAPNGKRYSIYGSSEADVQKKLRKALTSVDNGEYVEPSQLTVGKWLDTWFTTYAQPILRESTAAIHYENIRLHLKPAFGKIELQKIRIEQIQQFVNKQNKKYAPSTIHKHMEPLQLALKQAVINKLITTSPMEGVKLPKMEHKEIQFLTKQEQEKLFAQIPNTTSGRAIQFILATGLRASEICGLQWQDIDNGVMHIRRGVQKVRSVDDNQTVERKLIIATPKTRAGQRPIPFFVQVNTLLERQRIEQIEQRLKAGSGWFGGDAGKGDTYVFATELGTPCDRNNLARSLRKMLDDAGLAHRGLHALRHTFATNAVQAGIDTRTLSEILGHTKVAFTMQQYVHSNLETKKEAMRKMEGMLQSER